MCNVGYFTFKTKFDLTQCENKAPSTNCTASVFIGQIIKSIQIV